MTITYTDEYWSSQFDITQDDLKRVAERLEREGRPQDLKAIAQRIVKGRIQHGNDLSPAVLSKLTGKPSVRLWDPAGDWEVGDVVLVATTRKNSSYFEAFLGDIIGIDPSEKMVQIRIEGVDKEVKKFVLAAPGSENARKWHDAVRSAVEIKLQSGNLDQQVEGIILKHGERILSRLTETLQLDLRFSSLDGKWYINNKLPRIEENNLKAIHRTLLQNPSASENEILSVVKPGAQTDETLFRMAVHFALGQSLDRFENAGTLAHPQWKARPPEPGQAEVTHFAYDPETYLILCRPGQRLNQKNAQRLHELGLYPRVVAFAT